MGGDSTCVPPNFNSSMREIWEELWEAMPQSGKVSVTVQNLLKQYKQRCLAERKEQLCGNRASLTLLPVSFAQAKDWLVKQQKSLSSALNVGTVNEEAAEVVRELNVSLSEQPTSTARLLQQDAQSANPVIPPPQMSLGPEPVTQEIRAEERRKRPAIEKPCNAPPVKKPKKQVKPVPPELAERQQRASARMLELGVKAIEVN